jgi:hypothetical protein
MLYPRRLLFLLVAGLAMAIEGCAGASPGNLDAQVNGSRRVLLGPAQNRSPLLEPRNMRGAPDSERKTTRPVLAVTPGSMAVLSQSGTMLTQNSDGTIGIRNFVGLAARPGRSEQARQADLFGGQGGFLNPVLVQWLYPSCPLPD